LTLTAGTLSSTSGGGSVTSIVAGTNLTGGTITGAGTIALAGTVSGVDFVSGTIDGSVIGGVTPAAVTATRSTATVSVSASSAFGAFNYGTLNYSDTNNVFMGIGFVNSYVQAIVANGSGAAVASADVILSVDNTTATTNYGNLGRNSSGFTGSGSFNLANATYLTSFGGDLVLGTGTANAIRFVTNGGTTDALAINSGGTVTTANALPRTGQTFQGIRFWDGGAVMTAGTYGLNPNWNGPNATPLTMIVNPGAGTITGVLRLNGTGLTGGTVTASGAIGTATITAGTTITAGGSLDIVLSAPAGSPSGPIIFNGSYL
jgi:hypothetical protein